MIPDKETRDIQAYINDTLPQSRRAAFELKLQNDPDLKQRVEELRPIIEVFEEMKMEEKIKEIIKKDENQVFTKEEVITKPITKLQPRFGNVLRYAIAASLLIFLGITWYDLTLSSRLYQDFYTSEIEGSRGKETGNCPEEKAMNLYYQKNYQSFIQTLEKQAISPCNNYYKGMAFLGLGNPHKAIEYLSIATFSDEKITKQKAEWYLALAYLKNKETEKSKAQLLKIMNSPEHQYANLAKDLSIQLENKPILFK
jgi:hypothetical protein